MRQSTVMTLLAVLWISAAALAAASLLIMAWLILARVAASHRRRRERVERRALTDLLLGTPGAEMRDTTAPACMLLTEVAFDIIECAAPSHRAQIIARSGRLGVPQRLLIDLRARSARKRATAAVLLADFPDEDATAALTRALEDPDPDVRLAAALSLARLGRQPPARELVALLDLDPAEGSMLVASLFDDIAARHPEQILDLIGDPGQSWTVRTAAIDAMAVASDPSFVPRLVELVRAADPAAPEVPRYLEGLGAAGDRAAAPVVLANLDSEPPAVRAAAALAAGRLGLVEAGPRLAKMLADDDWWVRVRAGEALTDLGEPGQTLLQGIAECESGRTARAAQLAMAERGGAR